MKINRDLTINELNVAFHISRGLTNKQVAAVMGKSESTVRMQLQNAFHKLNIHNRTTLAIWYRKTYGESKSTCHATTSRTA